MEYISVFDEDSSICTITVMGKVKRPDDSLVLQKYALRFDNEKGCRKFLYDMRNAEFIGGTMDAYRTGSFMADLDHRQKRQKMALVYDEITEEHRFMETVAVNRGYQLRVFDQYGMNDAIEWLIT